MSFEPEILGFACNWCGYAGADQAGMNKMQYPTNIKLLRVMCLGQVDSTLVLKAFRKGFDGIMLVGCHIGDCHYVSGNKNAAIVVEQLKNILHYLGIEPERLRLEEVSGGEGPLFAKVVTEFVEALRTLGPSPLVINGVADIVDDLADNRAIGLHDG
jgi:coenzyme F420-reducing hydrogenase delta subunit